MYYPSFFPLETRSTPAFSVDGRQNPLPLQSLAVDFEQVIPWIYLQVISLP
jgi:hypothetical protein